MSTEFKTAIICMIHNAHEYVSEFIHYYLELCDHIYFIDHNSKKDLRNLKLDRVTVVRSNQEAQLQSECTNIVIEQLGLKHKYDWLFVLDNDEFLPFKTKSEFQKFLWRHRRKKSLQFYWHNGVPFYDQNANPASLIECDNIGIFKHHGRQYKCAVNVNTTKGQFFIPTGTHHISRIIPQWQKKIPYLKNNKIITAKIVMEPLYHIVAFNKKAFVNKIRNYVEQMKYREHVTGQGGWMVRDYPKNFENDDQWLWFIANFRVSQTDQHYKASRQDFIKTKIFEHLNKNFVLKLRDQILNYADTKKKKALSEEKEYLAYKKDDRDVMNNIEWFSINHENEIIIQNPGK